MWSTNSQINVFGVHVFCFIPQICRHNLTQLYSTKSLLHGHNYIPRDEVLRWRLDKGSPLPRSTGSTTSTRKLHLWPAIDVVFDHYGKIFSYTDGNDRLKKHYDRYLCFEWMLSLGDVVYDPVTNYVNAPASTWEFMFKVCSTFFRFAFVYPEHLCVKVH